MGCGWMCFFATSVVIAVVTFHFASLGAFRVAIEERERWSWCSPIYGVSGAEDVSILDGVAFLSAADHRTMTEAVPSRGDIFIMDLSGVSSVSDQLPAPLKLTLVGWPERDTFHPHGLSVRRMTDGVKVLVVNHVAGDDRVEEFSFNENDKTLVYVRTHTNSKFHSLNDVSIVDDNAFLVTNDHGYGRQQVVMHVLETLVPSLFARGSVVLVDAGESVYLTPEALAFPNGVSYDAATGVVVYAESSAQRVHVLRLERSDARRLTVRGEATSVEVHSGVDNVEVIPMGSVLHGTSASIHSVLVGSHLNMPHFLAHALELATEAPSHVVQVDIDVHSLRPLKVSTVFMSDGSDVSASSVGAAWRGLLLIGPVFDDHVLLCSAA